MGVCLNLNYVFFKAKNCIEKKFVLLKAYLGMNHCTDYCTSETTMPKTAEKG